MVGEVFGSMKALIKKFYHKLNIKLFGNRIGILPNLLHVFYDLIRKFSFIFLGESDRKAAEYAKKLKESGYLVLTLEEMEEQCKEVSQELSGRIDDEKYFNQDLSDSGIRLLKKSITDYPKFIDYVHSKPIRDIILNYYKSFFRIFRFDIYRTYPVKQKENSKFNSLHWHFDNAANSSLKLMIYLTDTNRESGAITLVPRKDSEAIKKRGFWNRFEAEDFVEEIEEKKIIIEGKSGTFIFFTPQFCLHKATLPTQGFRDVGVFLFHPTVLENEKYNDADLEKINYNGGYMLNPFTKRPLKYGLGTE
jgi:hypothetical protein